MRVYAATFALCTIAMFLTSEPCCGSNEYQEAATVNWQSASPLIWTEANYAKAANKTEAAHNRTPSWCTAIERPEWWVVIVAALTGFFIAKQSREMARATGVMQSQWTTMQGQLSQMERQANEMTTQTGHLEKSVAAAVDNAKAAKVSADIAAGMALPKLVVHEISGGFTGAAALPAQLQLPKVVLVIKNYGQTPALLHDWSLVFTCEELPDVPIYTGRRGSGMELTHQVIPPDKPYTLTVDNHLHRQGFSLADVQAIIEQEKILQCYGFVCYGDIFGNPLQRFKFHAMALDLTNGRIDWRTEYAPDAYIGTDRLPGKSPQKQNRNPN
jgi:hypothetical protein